MDQRLIRNWVGLFLLGTINNLPYVIVTSAASTIADSFGKKNLIGLVFGANVALSAVVKVINGAFLLNVPYSIRYLINAGLMLIGLFGVAYAPSFWFSLVCIVFVGASSAFGEKFPQMDFTVFKSCLMQISPNQSMMDLVINVALGYLRLFPSKLVNAWSSGTGMAGVLGSLLYVTFGCVVRASGSGFDADTETQTHLRHLTQYAFLLTTPFVAVYLVAFYFIIKVPQGQLQGQSQGPFQGQSQGQSQGVIQSRSGSFHNDNEEGYLDNPQTERLIDNRQDVDSPSLLGQKETYFQRVKRCFKLVWWLSVNLWAVYLFEYIAQGCAAKVRPDKEYHIGCPELYAALSLCYQAGVFVSRSSVQLVKIRRVEILSIIQFANMLLWILDVHFKILPVSILPALMIFVGLLGGASYVNIFYLLLHDERYPDKDRELCINITALFITFGIIGGTVLETILFVTVLKH